MVINVAMFQRLVLMHHSVTHFKSSTMSSFFATRLSTTVRNRSGNGGDTPPLRLAYICIGVHVSISIVPQTEVHSVQCQTLAVRGKPVVADGNRATDIMDSMLRMPLRQVSTTLISMLKQPST